jgi:hypothetical protein
MRDCKAAMVRDARKMDPGAKAGEDPLLDWEDNST